MDLLVGGVVHEAVVVVFLVEVLHLAVLELCGLEGLAGAVGAVEGRAGDHVFHLGAVERLPFARLREVEVGDDVRLVVDGDLQAFSQIGCSVHGSSSFLIDIWIGL